MQVSEEEVLRALGTVEDPDLKKDLVSLGMIKDVVIEDDTLSFTVNLTTPACPLKEIIRNNCIEAIKTLVSEEINIVVNITADVTSSLEEKGALENVKNIIAISSGKGGVGKSTVSTNLAIALAEAGAKVGLIDADIYGPSIPVMMGMENERPGVVEEDGKSFVIPLKKYGVEVMSIGFLTPADDALVWRGPMASSALKQFFNDVKWSKLDYLLIDLPPGTSDIHLTMVQSVPVTGAVVVTTPQKVALADAQKGVAMFKQAQINVPVLGIIENMAYFSPAELPENKYYIFGKDGGKELAKKHQVPFLGQIPIVQSIRESGDEGKPAVLQNNISGNAFNALGETLAQQIAIRNANLPATNEVEVKI